MHESLVHLPVKWRPSSRTIWLFSGATVVSVALNSLFPIADAYVVSPKGDVAAAWAVLYLGLLVLVALLAVPVSALALLVPAWRPVAKVTQMVSVVCDALVPRYLPAVPVTGMGAYPAYEYITGAEARKRYHGNDWVLQVDTPSGGINFDIFIYFPKQNYPAYDYGGWLERVGKWAYVHE